MPNIVRGRYKNKLYTRKKGNYGAAYCKILWLSMYSYLTDCHSSQVMNKQEWSNIIGQEAMY